MTLVTKEEAYLFLRLNPFRHYFQPQISCHSDR